MNNYIRQNTYLPTVDIISEEIIKQILWFGAANDLTSADIQSAGYILLPEPTGTQTDGDWLLAEKNQDGSFNTRWIGEVERLTIAMNKQLTTDARLKRNLLLAECDWTQGKDIPDAVSSQWTSYRQALRDITTQAGFPSNINWPQKPQ